MRLAKVHLARSIWLFDIQELNPRGLVVSPLLGEKFAKRYSFTTHPQPEDIVKGSAKWADGSFLWDDQRFELAVELHKDGIVADTRSSTDICDLFLHDCFLWMIDELKLTGPPRIQKRIYRSELVLYAGRGLSGLCNTLDVISAALSESFHSPQELSAIVFGSSANINSFTFERRINVPFEENAFFSSALMKTSSHIDILSGFEALLEPEPTPATDRPQNILTE